MKHRNHKILAISLAVLMAVFLFAGTYVQAAAKISLSQSEITLETGKSTTIKVKNAGKKVPYPTMSRGAMWLCSINQRNQHRIYMNWGQSFLEKNIFPSYPGRSRLAKAVHKNGMDINVFQNRKGG